MQNIEVAQCQICYDYKPLHNTEKLWNSGKKIIACQDCIGEDDIQLARNFSLLTGIGYDRLVNV